IQRLRQRGGRAGSLVERVEGARRQRVELLGLVLVRRAEQDELRDARGRFERGVAGAQAGAAAEQLRVLEKAPLSVGLELDLGFDLFEEVQAERVGLRAQAAHGVEHAALWREQARALVALAGWQEPQDEGRADDDGG